MKDRIALYVETVLASMFTFLFVLTLVWRDWIERVFGVDPDHHSGSVEWILVVVLGIAAVGVGLLARRTWRRVAAV